MSSPAMTLPKSVVVRLAAVPFDAFDTRETQAADLTLNVLEALNMIGARWYLMETHNAVGDSLILTVDNAKVYTLSAGQTMGSETLAGFRKLDVQVVGAATFNLYTEGWSKELLNYLGANV